MTFLIIPVFPGKIKTLFYKIAMHKAALNAFTISLLKCVHKFFRVCIFHVIFLSFVTHCIHVGLESISPFKASTIYNCDSLSQRSFAAPSLLLTATHAANEPKMQRHSACVCRVCCVCVCALATMEEPHPLPLAWIFSPQLDGCPSLLCNIRPQPEPASCISRKHE